MPQVLGLVRGEVGQESGDRAFGIGSRYQAEGELIVADLALDIPRQCTSLRRRRNKVIADDSQLENRFVFLAP